MDYKITNKIYLLSPKDRRLVDEEFDRMHKQERMSWSTEPMPFRFPVFVIWKTIKVDGQEPIQKGKVVVNIRGLNKIMIPNAYPMPLQSDIIYAMRGCMFISMIDGLTFFHQWLVQMMDRHKFTIVSHHGQEQMNITVIGFMGSPAYI